MRLLFFRSFFTMNQIFPYLFLIDNCFVFTMRQREFLLKKRKLRNWKEWLQFVQKKEKKHIVLRDFAKKLLLIPIDLVRICGTNSQKTCKMQIHIFYLDSVFALPMERRKTEYVHKSMIERRLLNRASYWYRWYIDRSRADIDSWINVDQSILSVIHSFIYFFLLSFHFDK